MLNNINFSVISLSISCITFLPAFGNHPSASSSSPNLRGSGMNFIENKGQVVDMSEHLRPDILFTGDGGGMKVYLKTTGLSYVLSKCEGFNEDEKDPKHFEAIRKRQLASEEANNNSIANNLQPSTIKLHRIDMDFSDCNPEAILLKQDEVEGYTNYYYAHCPEGITNVKGYNKIVYQNIYNNIDIVFHGGKEHGLEYDFIVKPGADPNDIKIKYTGADNISIENSKLKIESSLGSIEESIPRVYQNVNGKIVDVKAEYVLDGTTVKIKIATFNPKL